MSTLDYRGPSARKNRRGPQSGPSKSWLTAVASLWFLPPLLVASVPIADRAGALLGGDAAVTDAIPVAVEEERTLRETLPRHVNERVQWWIERLRSEERAAFTRLLEERARYVQLISGKLEERGMPEELVYLAVVESGLSPLAVSRASAVGMWQFMSPTAVQYGLRMDEWVDERRDPERATDAALDYLTYLHRRYGSWYLAAAAYNAGPGRLDRVLRRHAEGRTGDEAIYWEVLEHLPRETREYVPRLLAATVLAEEALASGFTPSLTVDRVDRVFVPGGTSLAALARVLDVDVGDLRDLNPQLIRGVTPPGEAYGVRVPSGSSARVVAALRPGRLTQKVDD